jgi:toxin ParE1/3/4
VRRFPFLVFYVEKSDQDDVWRVLQAHRDVAAWMRTPT